MHFLVFWWCNYGIMCKIIKIFFPQFKSIIEMLHYNFFCLFKNLEGWRFLFLEVESSWFYLWRGKVLVFKSWRFVVNILWDDFCYFSWHVIFVHLWWLLLSLCSRAKFWECLNPSKLKLCIQRKIFSTIKWWFCLNYSIE